MPRLEVTVAGSFSDSNTVLFLGAPIITAVVVSVTVVKAVRAPVAPSFVRSVVAAAVSVGEVAARAAEVGSAEVG